MSDFEGAVAGADGNEGDDADGPGGGGEVDGVEDAVRRLGLTRYVLTE